MRACCCLAACLIGLASSAAEIEATHPAPSAPSRLRLTFLGLTAQAGVSNEKADQVSSLVIGEVAGTAVYDVLSRDDLAKVLGIERQKQLMGCGEGESCMAEIAGALNAERILSGTLQKIDDTYVVSLSLIEPSTVHVVARASRKTVESDLVDSVQSMVFELVNQDPVLGGRQVKPERGFGGFMLGVRGDVDFLGFSTGAGAKALPIAGGIVLEYARRFFGFALTLFPKIDFGGRLEVRLHPFVLNNLLRPHLAVGSTVFRSGAAMRGAVGVSVKLSSLQLFADVAYERFFDFASGGRYVDNAVIGGIGLGWLF